MNIHIHRHIANTNEKAHRVALAAPRGDMHLHRRARRRLRRIGSTKQRLAELEGERLQKGSLPKSKEWEFSELRDRLEVLTKAA